MRRLPDARRIRAGWSSGSRPPGASAPRPSLPLTTPGHRWRYGSICRARSAADYVASLAGAGIDSRPLQWMPSAVILERPVAVTKLPGFADRRGLRAGRRRAARRAAAGRPPRHARAGCLRGPRRQERPSARAPRRGGGPDGTRRRCGTPVAHRREPATPATPRAAGRGRCRRSCDVARRATVRAHPGGCTVLGDRRHSPPPGHQAAAAARGPCDLRAAAARHPARRGG